MASGAKQVIDNQQQIFTAELQEWLPSQAPLFPEFSFVSDRVRGCTTAGEAVLTHYSAFFLTLLNVPSGVPVVVLI